MKKARIVTLVLFILLCGLSFSSCKSEGMVEEKQTDNSYSISYSSFTSEKEFDFELKEESTVRITVVTYKGKLHMDIFKIKDNGTLVSYYTGTDIPTGESTLRLKKGKYRVIAAGEKHSGGFTIIY